MSNLEYIGEYGSELGVFIPFVYYLKTHGLLGGRKVISYQGMRPYYYFLEDTEYEEKQHPRVWVHPHGRHYLPAHLKSDDEVFGSATVAPLPEFHPPPYAAHYKSLPGLEFRAPKPLVLIQNKYNSEWGGPPVNYFSLEDLHAMVSALTPHFFVVYIRTNTLRVPGYSHDHNEEASFEFHDKPMLLNAFPKDFVIIEDLLHAYHTTFDFNTLKCVLQAHAFATISTIGGFNYYDAFFPSRHIIFRRDAPPQYNLDFYQRQHDMLCPGAASPITFATSIEGVMQGIGQLISALESK